MIGLVNTVYYQILTDGAWYDCWNSARIVCDVIDAQMYVFIGAWLLTKYWFWIIGCQATAEEEELSHIEPKPTNTSLHVRLP